MDNIVYEDGLGNQYDNNGNEIMDIQMEPSEKAKETNNPSAEKPQTDDKKGSYKHYKDVEKEQLFFLVEEKGMSVRAASQKLSINVRTAQGWLSKNNKDPQEYIQRSPGSGRPVGRPPVLTDEQNNYMIQLADENIDSVVLEDMLDALTEKFGYLQITRNGFYKFARQKYKAAFHINLKRNFSWFKEGSRAAVKVPKIRAKTTTTLGAISPFGVVNISVKFTGHYFNFISSVLDVMDRHEQFRGHYLVTNNAPIYTHEDIQKHIESRSYGCVYLPPYSPELNPIEQFWSVCKSKLKREQLLDEETL
ncbi:hypothetical protein G6F57_001098 [Rhizopus arrhizus]|uniref:Tc1-like transposase DDE domain-containing protein n=1 Tax=Rhizopus oryzae TaxID=64495 RepID=A0A9P7BXT8_RHIOR|nr:hypothetical protein G6F23_003055 [Rhizopus arrhizus]KAG1420106.1 hypothetical protein G6F58_004323 [Rhizopus delemar]KAG0788939.1 hypothetical protein G6F21_006853 [Rhizopus arrhizus]KAG0801226.1 hypothetical protein G6F22_001452 [Rhizopus arrhizus]KAG0809662.1 hypothetical protein G6F20_008594 [Rhizopus arrhizus]